MFTPPMQKVAVALSVLPELAANLANTYPEVWIYDNGSNPQMKFANVKYRSETNLKFVGGWNDAMARIIADHHPEAVWMMNDDVEGAGQWMLERLFSAMDCCSDAALITPSFNSPHDIFHHQNQLYGLREVAWMDWCCPLVSVKAWEDVGPFDPEFVGYGADIDWCQRAKAKGYHFYVHEGCSIHHIGTATSIKIGASDVIDGGLMSRLLKKKYGKEWWELTR